MVDVYAVAEEAANVLERDGWTWGSYTNIAGEHCTVGAIKVAARESNSRFHSEFVIQTRTVNAFREFLGLAYDRSVEGWNDELYVDKVFFHKSRRRFHGQRRVVKELRKFAATDPKRQPVVMRTPHEGDLAA